MSKYYFINRDEKCHTIKGHIELMKDCNIKKLTVFEAKIETGTGYFFCKHFLEPGEVGESCGKHVCDMYTPNNGKNGRCKHYGYIYEQTNKKRLIKIK